MTHLSRVPTARPGQTRSGRALFFCQGSDTCQALCSAVSVSLPASTTPPNFHLTRVVSSSGPSAFLLYPTRYSRLSLFVQSFFSLSTRPSKPSYISPIFNRFTLRHSAHLRVNLCIDEIPIRDRVPDGLLHRKEGRKALYTVEIERDLRVPSESGVPVDVISSFDSFIKVRMIDQQPALRHRPDSRAAKKGSDSGIKMNEGDTQHVNFENGAKGT